jgi:hypothetical protein
LRVVPDERLNQASAAGLGTPDFVEEAYQAAA